MKHINYGIDLGTTNSCIACMDGDEVRVVPSGDQMNVTPSVVRVLRSGSILTGLRAYNAVVTDPDNVAAEFKRLMGQKYEKTFPSAGRAMSPEELSAEVLKSLLTDARRRTGEDVRASVITVPAAFTTLQCEATARAAQLAGLEEYPLLQEPIAAALAYGVRADARGQRWLVFDLGGGTLDVAIVSTRDGRLSVLEHRGDNHLGGKDVDRLIVQNIFLPFLGEQFALPTAYADAPELGRLTRKLNAVAERAKIDLSTADETVVSFIDLGEDLAGTPIEADLRLTRSALESEVEPLVARCLRLAEDALAGARIEGRDLDRILLVGGPTQMPYVRSAVSAQLGARVDFSLDPMTVVARGACLYGSTIERRADAATKTSVAAPGKVRVRLAFESVSDALQCPVAGIVERRATNVAGEGGEAREARIDAASGYWTSGWHPLGDDGYFEMPVTLEEGKTSVFVLSLRDASGRVLEAEPREFQIRHGLTFSAPPLPHTISVEVAEADGERITLHPVFPRMSLLPAEKSVSFRAAQTLRPSELETSLAIKLWEGEAFSEPQANTWVGNMHIRSEYVRRPIPEGAEVQLHIKIDASRLITVEVFVPHLNEHFTERIYIPQEEEPNYLELFTSLQTELETSLARLDRLEERLLLVSASDAAAEDVEFPELVFEEDELPSDERERRALLEELSPRREAQRLRREIEDLDIEIGLQQATGSEPEHDLAKGYVERARELRARIANLERESGLDKRRDIFEDALRLASEIAEDVVNYGDAAQRERFQVLDRELRRAASHQDARGVQKSLVVLKHIRRQILHAQEWFWRDWFAYFQRPGRRFVNAEEAQKWLASGEAATARGDQPEIEKAVRKLWELQPVEEQQADSERALRPGLKL
ncbi:MAG TPA: Hsp70 family protein [Pyrinomonadaceae bacterium]|jgi:molecular chaperone DnaK